MLAWQREQAEAEAQRAREQQQHAAMHRDMLMVRSRSHTRTPLRPRADAAHASCGACWQEQITKNEHLRKEKRDRYVEEGRVFSKVEMAERARLEAIKAQKLAELEKAGVPEKYRAELARKKVRVCEREVCARRQADPVCAQLLANDFLK
jgi:hypothetical protein